MNRARSRGGFTLLEVLAYLAVLVVVVAGAYQALYEGFHHTRRLQRNVDDIIGAVRAGERWRADLRAATGPVRTAADGSLTIPQPDGAVVYRWVDGVVRRNDTTLLRAVQSSVMRPDRRGQVTAWHWELELTATKPARLTPLFSFVGVAGPQEAP